MTKKKQPSHIHKFIRKNLTRDPKKKPYNVLACVEPGCSAYYVLALCIGKLATCWRCGTPFIIDAVSVDHLKPHCQACIKRKTTPEIDKLTELAEEI